MGVFLSLVPTTWQGLQGGLFIDLIFLSNFSFLVIFSVYGTKYLSSSFHCQAQGREGGRGVQTKVSRIVFFFSMLQGKHVNIVVLVLVDHIYSLSIYFQYKFAFNLIPGILVETWHDALCILFRSLKCVTQLLLYCYNVIKVKVYLCNAKCLWSLVVHIFIIIFNISYHNTIHGLRLASLNYQIK